MKKYFWRRDVPKSEKRAKGSTMKVVATDVCPEIRHGLFEAVVHHVEGRGTKGFLPQLTVKGSRDFVYWSGDIVYGVNPNVWEEAHKQLLQSAEAQIPGSGQMISEEEVRASKPNMFRVIRENMGINDGSIDSLGEFQPLTFVHALVATLKEDDDENNYFAVNSNGRLVAT